VVARRHPEWTSGRSGIVTAQEDLNPQGRFTISKDFEFCASHELRLLPEMHKCSRNHGHNYVVTLTLTADRLDEYGFVTDFGDLAPFGDYLKTTWDHRLINDRVDFHPTSELLAHYLGRWFIDNVEPSIHGRLASVRVAETRLSSALWERPDAS
jgi:6-pyruvoyltetrahydropterin/6-carboxytetrahydropterin synthase